MSQPIEIIQRDGQTVVRIATPQLQADLELNPAPPVYQAGAARTPDDIRRAIGDWQQQGYCLEDASVLACVTPANTLHHTVLTAASPLLNAACFPRLIDHNSDRPSELHFLGLTNTRPGVYPIVDNLSHLESLMAAGAQIIQLRMKSEHCTPEIRHAIQKAVELNRRYPACQLFINDYWQEAIEAGAYGVHLGQEDLLVADLSAIARQGLRLGVSSHAFWEVTRALCIHPSYIACGPLFPTRAKKMPWISQGIDNLRYWVRLIPCPVIGIGGVNEGNLHEIHASGCASASIIQAIVSAADPAKEYQRLQAMWLEWETVGDLGLEDSGSRTDPLVLAKPTLAT
jgi:hydroxymethylpyrimidine kinase/phosphomethylpyrimidine kinase/thiamine-phosphate diphosphorylase